MNLKLILMTLAVMGICRFEPPTTYGADAPDDLSALSPSVSFASYEQRIRGLEEQLAAIDTGHDDSSCGCHCHCCNSGWFATMDYLNWQIERNDLGFAILDPGAIRVPAGG